MSGSTIPDPQAIAAAGDMIGGWDADVFSAINVTEARILAELLDELGRTDTADHVIRQTWLAESEDDRDPTPWADRHDSRLSEADYQARSEGRERFTFDPRTHWPDEA